MDKTIVVEVCRRVRHPRYQKVMNKFKKFYAHDEQGQAGIGDTVRIVSIAAAEQAQAVAPGRTS